MIRSKPGSSASHAAQASQFEILVRGLLLSQYGYMSTNRIGEERKARGMTQQELGDAVGAHWITISKLERGRIKLTTEWLERLAKPLDVSPAELLERRQFTAALAEPEQLFPFANRLLSGTKKLPADQGLVEATIDSDAYEPMLHLGDRVHLIPLRDLKAKQRRRIQGRLGLYDGGSKSRFGFLYLGRKKDTYDLFWLGRRVVEAATAARVFIAQRIFMGIVDT